MATRIFLICVVLVAMAFALCQGSRTCFAQGLTPVLQDDVIDLKSAEGQGLDLEALVKLLAAEENLKIYFDQDDFPKTDKLLFFGEVKLQPGEQFFQFVQLVLRNRGYAIVPSDLEGIHRIVPLSNIRPFVPRRDANDNVELNSGLQNGDYVTAIFSLTHISPDAAEAFLRDFMPAASAAATDPQNATENVVTKLPPNILIVTEMAGRIERIKNAIAAIDVPRNSVCIVNYSRIGFQRFQPGGFSLGAKHNLIGFANPATNRIRPTSQLLLDPGEFQQKRITKRNLLVPVESSRRSSVTGIHVCFEQ